MQSSSGLLVYWCPVCSTQSWFSKQKGQSFCVRTPIKCTRFQPTTSQRTQSSCQPQSSYLVFNLLSFTGQLVSDLTIGSQSFSRFGSSVFWLSSALSAMATSFHQVWNKWKLLPLLLLCWQCQQFYLEVYSSTQRLCQLISAGLGGLPQSTTLIVVFCWPNGEQPQTQTPLSQIHTTKLWTSLSETSHSRSVSTP